jgi:hypothetical protein
MIYKHKKTGQTLQIKAAYGDIATCYVLDENLNKIIEHNKKERYKTVVCNKNNLLEVLM